MKLIHKAMAGTMESSDIMVTIEPKEEGGIELELTSSVMQQFGRQIEAVILETLKGLGVENARVTAADKGALDCTIKARVECAVFRSNEIKDGLPWGGAIR